MKKQIKLYLILLFLIILLFPSINAKFRLLKEFDNNENRKPSEKPTLDINFLDPYPQNYESYYNDTFSLRNQLVKFYAYLSVKLYKKSPVPEKIFIGKNDRLFAIHEEKEVFSAKNAFTQDEIKLFINEIKLRQEYITSKGAQMIFVICPTKGNIYPEDLSKRLCNPENSRTKKLVDSLKIHVPNLQIIDLSEALSKAKDTIPVFYNTDNHWNAFGGYVGYYTIIKELKNTPRFANIKLVSLNDYSIDTVDYDGNIARMANIGPYIDDVNYLLKKHSETTIESKIHDYKSPEGFPYPWAYYESYTALDTNAPSLLVINDSFIGAIGQFLKESFSRSTYIFDAWKYRFNKEIIDTENPDIVIYLIYEPLIDNILKNMTKPID